MKEQLEAFWDSLKDKAIAGIVTAAVKYGLLIMGGLFLMKQCSKIGTGEASASDPMAQVEALPMPKMELDHTLDGAVAILREEMGIRDTSDAVTQKLYIIAERLLTEGARGVRFNKKVLQQYDRKKYWTDWNYRQDVINAVITPIETKISN